MMDRWGKGTGCAERQPDTAAAAQAKAAVEAMIQARSKQDAELFGIESAEEKPPVRGVLYGLLSTAGGASTGPEKISRNK